MATSFLDFQKTEDGSLTIFSKQFQETYHSRHGAITESLHVYINQGLIYKMRQKDGPLKVGEMGLGTGMNAFLTMQAADKEKRSVFYSSIEAFPLQKAEINRLKTEAWVGENGIYEKMINAADGQKLDLSPYFQFECHHRFWPQTNPFQNLDLLFYDAFAPGSQPELWDEVAMKNAWDSLLPGGVLVTYCAKSYVKRILKQLGFTIERLKGPPGKLEMTRATKPEY